MNIDEKLRKDLHEMFDKMVDKVITDEFIDDIMCTAFEGGINYWVRYAELSDEAKIEMENDTEFEYTHQAISRDHEITLVDMEDEEVTYNLNKDKFIKGIVMYWINHGFETDAGNIDAWGADMIVQYAVFDRIMFS
jgi:hypothetical protein